LRELPGLRLERAPRLLERRSELAAGGLYDVCGLAACGGNRLGMTGLRRLERRLARPLGFRVRCADCGFVAGKLGLRLLAELCGALLRAVDLLVALVEHAEQRPEEQAVQHGYEEEEEQNQKRHKAQVGDDLEHAFRGGRRRRKSTPPHREAHGERLARPIQIHRLRFSRQCRAEPQPASSIQPVQPAGLALRQTAADVPTMEDNSERTRKRH